MIPIGVPTDFIQSFLEHPSQRLALRQQMDDWAAQMPGQLLSLGEALLDAIQASSDPTLLISLYHRLVKSSCTVQNEALLPIALRLLQTHQNPDWVREGISRLAHHHDHYALVTRALETAAPQLVLSAIHEVVARGTDLTQHPSYQRLEDFQQQSDWQSLPLLPLSVEQQYSFPFYSISGASQTIEFGFPDHGFQAINRQTLPQLEIRLSQASALEEVVAHWSEDSNGEVYGAVGCFRQRLPPTEWLPQLPPFQACEGVVTAQRSAAECMAKLFNAASNSGAYGRPRYGALGRLKAWKAMRQLLQCPAQASIATIEEAMLAATWWEFNTDTWFVNSWLDLGLAATWVGNNGRIHFGVLAATDTD